MRKLSAPHFDQFSYWLLSWIFCIVTILTHSLRRCSFYILTLFRFANDKQFSFGSGIACQDYGVTSFSPTLAQIVPWMVFCGYSNLTILNDWKWNLGKAVYYTLHDHPFQNRQAMLLVTGLCCTFQNYLRDYYPKSSSFSLDRDTQAVIQILQTYLFTYLKTSNLK